MEVGSSLRLRLPYNNNLLCCRKDWTLKMNKPYPAFLTEDMQEWLNTQHELNRMQVASLTTAQMTVAFTKRFALTPAQAGKLLTQYAKGVGST